MRLWELRIKLDSPKLVRPAAAPIFMLHRLRTERPFCRSLPTNSTIQREIQMIDPPVLFDHFGASCKKIRNERGTWEVLEAYIQSHSEAKFSHGICPECMRKLFLEYSPR